VGVDSSAPNSVDGLPPADVRRIEQRAIGAVVDVQLAAAALFDADQHAGIFSAQCTARLAPQFGRIADRQLFERAVDDFEIGFEGGGLHAGIPARETAADVDNV